MTQVYEEIPMQKISVLGKRVIWLKYYIKLICSMWDPCHYPHKIEKISTQEAIVL